MKVFISHSQKDAEFAKELTARLSDARLDVWLAEREVLPGDNWQLEVGKALQRSDAMVVLLSPDGVAAENVRHDIGFAMGSPKFEGRLIPVILGPTNTEAIPWFLRSLPMIEAPANSKKQVKQIAEKIVLSLRGGNGGKSRARGMLDVAKAS